ncbi:MAG: SagB/ThcOx family dehydrogenase [Candidatus Shapirobacteria bacterium]|jgi:SagB-type dehydrogenase family enzyme
MDKQYTRLKKIKLPDIKTPEGELQNTILKRKSYRDFSSKSISKQALTKILYYSSGVVRPNLFESNNPFRVYPSAGAKYPLEIYVLVMTVRGVDRGLYHYNPLMNYLDILSLNVTKKELDPIWMEKQKWFENASVIIFITSIFDRTTDKYGARGVMFPYIEAGHIAQNIYLLATSLNIGCCAIGMLNEKFVIKLLDINPRKEYPIYYLAVGN